MKTLRSYLKIISVLAVIVAGAVSCEKDEEIVFKELTPAGEIEETVWDGHTTVYIENDVVVPAGKTLTIEAGAKIVFKGSKLGTAEAPEFQVRGNLYVLGTSSNPIQFTVENVPTTMTEKLQGLWGGIQCASTCAELVLDHAVIEYAGAPAGANSIFVEQGESDGDPRYAITFGNFSGKYIMHNSLVQYSADDATRVLGGKVSFVGNTFAFCGETGGEAINIKSGTEGDMAFNLFYSIATNGTKWSNSGDNSPQTDCKSYNNTFVNCGWRRNKEGRGGSVNIEKNGRGASYNQLIVNCKYGVRVVGGDDIADVDNVLSDNAFYFGNEQIMVDEFYPTLGELPYAHNTCAGDVKGAVNANDPIFANYDVSTDERADLPASTADFYLKSSSPALTGAKTDFTPKFATLTAGGVTYTNPAPKAHFGAFGTK